MRFRQCPGADSNRYAFRHHPLKMACLPISPPGQELQLTADCLLLTANYQLLKKTGPTGLEPATSRVTVECSNQTELRPQQTLAISQLHFDTETTENTDNNLKGTARKLTTRDSKLTTANSELCGSTAQ